MPIEHRLGTTVITGPAIRGYAAVTLKYGIKLYLETNGQVLPTRGVTAGKMREMVTRFTGKTYPRSRKGLEQAYVDLCAMMDERNYDLDKVGEASVVNEIVGVQTATEK